MGFSKKYSLLILVLIVLFGMLILLNRAGEPLEEYLKLPRCEINEVVITEDMKLDVLYYSNEHLTKGLGGEYFEEHYNFLNIDYDISDCIFEIKYIYKYERFHTPASISVKVLSEKSFEIIDVNAFLIPVEINIDSSRAKSIADFNEIDYNYYNLEADFERQTLIYVFYRETLVEGNVPIFQVDAQSGKINHIREAPLHVTIV